MGKIKTEISLISGVYKCTQKDWKVETYFLYFRFYSVLIMPDANDNISSSISSSCFMLNIQTIPEGTFCNRRRKHRKVL